MLDLSAPGRKNSQNHAQRQRCVFDKILWMLVAAGFALVASGCATTNTTAIEEVLLKNLEMKEETGSLHYGDTYDPHTRYKILHEGEYEKITKWKRIGGKPYDCKIDKVEVKEPLERWDLRPTEPQFERVVVDEVPVCTPDRPNAYFCQKDKKILPRCAQDEEAEICLNDHPLKDKGKYEKECEGRLASGELVKGKCAIEPLHPFRRKFHHKLVKEAPRGNRTRIEERRNISIS
uniref:Uncharacterized protein n=1 Tax=Candidatus Kentrum sp. LPFa TaxID=2126335 RepID=A0A450WZK5_9GAMM|nr:MAG: hypothetical protein BECKLPF1236B_GA0070989_13102 [Candidatus Kentron sp. LPFa]